MSKEYTDEELIEMIRRCKENHGVVTPQLFNEMESTCSASTVMRRFGSWDEARKAAGIEEDNSHRSGRKRQYTDGDILRHIRKCADQNDGKATVSLMNDNPDLVAPSVAVKRFGSWSNAKEKSGIKSDARADNHRPREYSDEEYYELLRECENRHGKVTQQQFDQDDDFPSSGAVAQRFGSWSQAKQLAGVDTATATYTDEELLDQMAECKKRYGKCTSDTFAQDDDFASPETVQRRFKRWNNAKNKAKEYAEDHESYDDVW